MFCVGALATDVSSASDETVAYDDQEAAKVAIMKGVPHDEIDADRGQKGSGEATLDHCPAKQHHPGRDSESTSSAMPMMPASIIARRCRR